MPFPIGAFLGGSIFSGLAGLYGADEAADAQQDAAQGALREGRRQYNLNRQDLAPYTNIGSQAINALGSMYGYQPYQQPDSVGFSSVGANDFNAITPYWQAIRPAANFSDINWNAIGLDGPPVSPETANFLATNWGAIRPAANFQDIDWTALNFSPMGGMGGSPQPGAPQPVAAGPGMSAPDYSNFFASPDYQFRRSEGLRGIEQTAAARGGALSGNALRGISNFNSGLAAGEFGNYFNRQAALAGIGQASTGQQAALGANYANNAGNAMMNAGDARASGILGKTAALSNMGNGIADYLMLRRMGV